MSRFLGLAALLAAIAAGCTSKSRGPNAPVKGERWVSSVSILGNDAFDDGDIADGLVSHKATGLFIRTRVRYDAALVETDSKRIETFYQQRGYFDAEVVGVQATKQNGLATKLIFTVEEGQPTIIDEVQITGIAEPDSLLAKLKLKRGERFDYQRYDEGKEQIIATLRAQGYAHVKLTAKATVDRTSRTAKVRYDVDRGPLVRIGDIEVYGLGIVPKSAVMNRLTFEPGDRFSAQAIADSRAQLRSLSRFGVIRIDFADNSRAALSDIAITVKEGPRRELRVGGGAAFDGGASLDNSQWLIRGRAGYTLRGIIDALTTLNAELRPGYSFQTSDGGDRSIVGEADVSLTREDLFFPRFKGSAALGYDIRAFDAFTSRGPGVRLQTDRPLWRRRIHVGIGWQIELLCFSDRAAILSNPMSEGYDGELAERLGVDRSCGPLEFPTASGYKLAFFEESITLEGRDNLLDTRRGYYLEARFEQAGAFTGSEFGYLKVTPEARGYYPLGSRIVFAARVRYGRSFAGDVPITRRYFSGGASSQRGFGQRQLSPVAGDLETSEVEIGGEELLESSLEGRLDLVPLWGAMLGVAAFVDAGDVGDRDVGIDLGNLHVAVGGGLRWRTPIGPARLDVGYRATRRGAGEIHARNSLAWHLSIGEAF